MSDKGAWISASTTTRNLRQGDPDKGRTSPIRERRLIRSHRRRVRARAPAGRDRGAPFGALKYTGNKTAYPHPGGGSYDDGKTHTTLTDLRGGVRYQVLEAPVALSPHLAVSIPVADYETVGNTVAGRHLKMLHVGLGIGRVFGSATYVHVLYEFSLAEKFDRTPETSVRTEPRRSRLTSAQAARAAARSARDFNARRPRRRELQRAGGFHERRGHES